jgi:acetyl-CoA carboxylase biotin carboxyl carrier protein
MPAKKASKPKAVAIKASPKAGTAISIKPLTESVLEQLNGFLKKSGLAEIEIKQGDASVRLSRSGSSGSKAAPSASMADAAPAPAAAPTNTFNSPMIGTFYRSASPESAPFVKVGDTIRAGQTICIIEAMKTMNQIESDRSGKLVKILLDNATPVEYGQPLFVIE